MIEINNTTKTKIDTDLVKVIANSFLKKYKKTKMEVSIAFVGDTVMRRLNKIYRGKDKPTDVLTFEGDDGFLGEIIIDYSQIKRQAKKFSPNSRQELIFILVHGLLHLLGHEDETEKGRLEMIRLGEEFIKSLKFQSSNDKYQIRS